MNIFCRILKWMGVIKANKEHWEKPKEIVGMDIKAVVKKSKKRNAKSK